MQEGKARRKEEKRRIENNESCRECYFSSVHQSARTLLITVQEVLILASISNSRNQMYWTFVKIYGKQLAFSPSQWFKAKNLCTNIFQR
jgi:hypothetical protein